MCKKHLSWPPPPWHKPGWNAERFCDTCAPRILVHVMFRGNEPRCVQFTDGPWLLFATEEEVINVLRWAGADVNDYYRSDKSHASLECNLDERKRYLLKWRAQGWPWNGYELQQFWNAGTYPPKKLTPQQERVFLVNRERKQRKY